jgi:Mrp family chromosome partitioning ATPase
LSERDILVNTLDELSRTKAQLQVNLQDDLAFRPVTVPATMPTRTASNHFLANVVLGGVIGLIVGAIAAFVLASFRRRFEGPEDPAELYRAPVLTVVPAFELEPWVRTGLPTVTRPIDESAESYRSMATTLRALRGSDKSLVVAFAAADLGSGTTTTVANCGIALATMGERTVVVDADALGRGLTQALVAEKEHRGLPEIPPGFSELLTGRPLPEAIESSMHGEGLMVIPSGRNADLAIHRWRPSALRDLLETLAERFDMVLIDCPPIGSASYGMDVIATVGRLIMVVPHHDRVELHETIAARLPSTDVTLLGYVYNGAVPNHRYSPYFPVVSGGSHSSAARPVDRPVSPSSGSAQPTPAPPPEASPSTESARDDSELLAVGSGREAGSGATTGASGESRPPARSTDGGSGSTTSNPTGGPAASPSTADTSVVEAVTKNPDDTGMVPVPDPTVADTSVVAAVTKNPDDTGMVPATPSRPTSERPVPRRRPPKDK